jgi:hypothetical protein
MAKVSLPLSDSGAVTSGVGKVTRVIVSTHSSGVIKLIDSPNSTAGRVLLSDLTLTTGAQVLDLGDVEFYEGIYFDLVSGTATVQVVFEL